MSRISTVQPLTVALIQQPLAWHDHAANRQALGAAIAAIDRAVDLIVLPEMFSTGFTMQPTAAFETMSGETVAWMKAQAARTGAVVCGSLAMRVEEAASPGFVNRLLWAQSNGELEHYDKRHLFRMSGEHEHYGAGVRRCIVELKGWRICLQICYDLRFPVWSRNRGEPDGDLRSDLRSSDARGDLRDDYDALLYVANWPAARQLAWETLLRARAIENLAYVIAVNRVGVDGNGLTYDGGSCVISPKGETLVLSNSVAATPTATLDHATLLAYREAFPAWRDADAFSIACEQVV